LIEACLAFGLALRGVGFLLLLLCLPGCACRLLIPLFVTVAIVL
jgi:hypothetical protein